VSWWPKQDQSLGQCEPATYPSDSWTGKRATGVPKGGLEFSAERSLESCCTRLLCCKTVGQQAPSGAGAKCCWNGNNGYLQEKGGRTRNHRKTEQAPGHGHTLRNGHFPVRQDRAEHDDFGSIPGSPSRKPMSASPASMLMDQLHRASRHCRSANAPAQAKDITEHRRRASTPCRIRPKLPGSRPANWRRWRNSLRWLIPKMPPRHLYFRRRIEGNSEGDCLINR
jgi:hypothetical protein